ncbi:hypothetical protein [Devosia sp.]|uniref:hypothetical protein n=1 Tax=Devosia sp. TaxID=1871048 RepID=UPI002FCB340C
MTDLTATQIAANIYKGMDENRMMHGGSFRGWDDEPKSAAIDAIDIYKEGEDYAPDLASDKTLYDDVVDELVEMIEDEMELEYDPDQVAEGNNEFKSLNFTHVAISWDPGLAFIAEAKTAAEALEAFRKDVSKDIVSEGLAFYSITTYEADRIRDIGDFNRIIRAADEREIFE